MVARRLGVLALAVVVLAPAVAQARKDSELRYRFQQVWGTTVRLVRVDYGFKIRDEDEGVGYLLFDYQDGNRTYPGSFELIKTRVDGEPRVKVQLSIPAMPGYIERMMLDKLEHKLRNDYGDPPPPPSKPASDDHDRRDDGKGKDEGGAHHDGDAKKRDRADD